ncbi:MAG: MarR family transcriptional regulator, transcriptional regulator for hemolysin [Gaiellaceae bacterium]|jgi:MarR family transcriptional regulator for hemolysin|nr:MarR family transcriptional regulator, transcriptional regulator for hemolysin [Gaiellaceae bacterium]
MKPQGTPIGRKLALTSKAVSSAFNAALAAEGGSVPVWLILNALKEGRWSTQLDLARSLGIEGPTLTRHLDNMEQSGFVARQPSETDRRAVRVEITEAGEAAHGRMLVAVIAFNRRLHAGVSRDELIQLDEILSRLENNLGAPARPAAPRRV